MENSAKNFIRYIDETIDVSYHSSAVRYVEAGINGNWLTNSYALISYLETGEVETIFRDSPTVLHRTSGVACYIPPGIWRRTVSSGGTTFKWSKLAFYVFHGVDLLSFFCVPSLFEPGLSREIGQLNETLALLEDDELTDPFTRAVKRKELCFKLLSMILEVSELKDNALRNFYELQRLAPVIEYLSRNFNKAIEVNNLAELAYLSKSQFHRKFKNTLGIAPMEYVKRRRIKEARKLLQRTDMSIAEVGDSVGWPDQFHFCRTFKAATGFSPSLYRREYMDGFYNLFGGI